MSPKQDVKKTLPQLPFPVTRQQEFRKIMQSPAEEKSLVNIHFQKEEKPDRYSQVSSK